MTEETKTFATHVILSVYTGRSMFGGSFSDIHEAIEHLLGEPVWTHSLARMAPWDRARAAIAAQHPKVANVDAESLEKICEDNSGDTTIADAVAAWAEAEIITLGKTLTFTRGHGRDADEAQNAALAELVAMAGDKPLFVAGV